jgi:glycine/D-amino acid oxidase-like deaminating enzyme
VLPKSASVVVVGGGVLGTSAAFHLAEAGCRNVVLLERGPIAGGTTPFAAGQTGYLNDDRFALQFGAYCVDFFAHFQERTGNAIDFRRCGSVRIALTEKFQTDLEKRRQAAHEIGHTDVEFLTPSRARQLAPTLQIPEGAAVLFIPRDGYADPKSVAVAYAAAAQERGVLIQTRTHVTGLDVAGGRVAAVQTEEGAIKSDWVVLAVGAWTRQFGRQVGLNLRAVPVRHQAFVTAPLRSVLPSQPIIRIAEPQIYARQEGGGLLVGGYGYRPLSVEMSDFPSDFEISALPADRISYQLLTEAAAKFFPALRGAIVVQERRGLPTISPDNQLLVSESTQIKGLVVASACGVGGVERSPGIGRLVAEIVSGKPTWLPPEGLSIDRFGDNFSADAPLRGRCEEVYAHHYHGEY